MTFKCDDCNKTFPDSDEQTGSLGDPKYCSGCFDPDEHSKDDDDGPNAEVQKKDRDDDDDDSHPWEGVIGPYGSPRTP